VTGALTANVTAPGNLVSVDQTVSGIGGHIPFQASRASNHQYKYCTLWIDHHTKFLYGHLQEMTTTKEILQSKEALETFANCHNIVVKHLQSDNGLFASADFGKHVEAHGQCHTLCGISAHWQNGMAEQYIGIITNHAHTMLLHAMNLWPDIITANFWTFTVKHAIRLHNMQPIDDHDNKCPYELFTGDIPPHHLLNFCVFGCPVYILKKNLADNNGIPKWKACSYQGVYVGHSDVHASNAVLVWNPLTKLVSPQYHVIFNKEFTTVSSAVQANHECLDIAFKELLSTCKWWHMDQFATTTEHDTEHYYFDSDWPPECPPPWNVSKLIPISYLLPAHPSRNQHPMPLMPP